VIELRFPLELSVTVNLDTPALAANLLAKTGIILSVPLPNQRWPVPHDYRRVVAEVAVASLIFDHMNALQIRLLRLLSSGEAIKDDWFTIDPTGRVELVRDWFEATLSGGPSPWFDMPPRPGEPDQWRRIALEVSSIDLMSPTKQRAHWDLRITALAGLFTALAAMGNLTLDAVKFVQRSEDMPVIMEIIRPPPPETIPFFVDTTVSPEFKTFRDSIVEALLKGNDRVAITQVQTHLAILGFYEGTIDGQDGPLTRNAAAQFAKKYGLSAADWRSEEFAYHLANVAVLQYNPHPLR
jgi:hypothetical protein